MDDPKRRGRGGGGGASEIEVTCPVCKEVVRVSEKKAAEEMTVRCSKGHEIPLVRLL